MEKFSGPGTVRFRSMVLATLNQKGADVVPNDKVTAAEADLGLLQVSDNYAAVAKELKVNAFFGGTIIQKRKKFIAVLTASGPNGKSLGKAAWAGNGLAKLFAAVGANLSKKMSAMLAGAGKSESVSDVDLPVAKNDSGGGAADEPPPSKSKGKKMAAADDDDAPKRKKKGGDDAEEAVSASADESEEGSAKSGWTKFDIQLGAHVYRRDFTYNDDYIGNHQAYKLPAVPAPALSLDYWFLKNFGATIGGEYSVGLISQDQADPPNRYTTSSLGYFIGAKYRYILGGGTELMAGLAFAGNSFKIVPSTGDNSPPRVAGVDYKQIRAGLAARIPLNDTWAIIGNADYLHLLSIGELRSDDYFPAASGRGGQGSAGVAFGLPWMKGLEGRATIDLRRYVFAFNSIASDKNIAGGATDQYLGLNIAVGWRN